VMGVVALVAAVALVEATAGPAEAVSAQVGSGFELRKTKVRPKRPLFDGKRRITLHYGFGARGPVDLRIRVVHVRSGNTVRVWRERDARPGRRLERRWNGLNRRGRAVKDGRYEFRVGPKGRRDRFAGRLRIHGHVFPVDGGHGSRGAIGEFGAPRNGGRTHEGFDILARCGTPLVAARGGRVKKSGYDDRLYGYFVLINARKSNEQYFYSHLIAPPLPGKGERVRTGERIGAVGQTGNARSTPCHLHFERRKRGRPVDPEPALRRWDRWS
jgi:murein DD-endopeptidase MepM/ murein hydrolase activator NlpD